MSSSNPEKSYIKMVIHGRGGQGAVTASQLIAKAAYLSGNFKDVHATPSFGSERRGAPVQAYVKLSTTDKIWDRSQIEFPDVMLVFDESILTKDIVSSLKEDGIMIINSSREPMFFREQYNLTEKNKIIVADITKLALQNQLTVDGNPIVNTPILGLLAKALPQLSVENLKTVILDKLGEKIGAINNKLIEEGYNLAKEL